MNEAATVPFTPPGIRTRRLHPQTNGSAETLPPAKQIVPIDEEVEQAALRFSTLAGNIKKERDSMREERDTYRARYEQSEAANNDLRSQLESQRALTDAAKAEAEHCRAEQVRLETVLLGIRNQAADALPE